MPCCNKGPAKIAAYIKTLPKISLNNVAAALDAACTAPCACETITQTEQSLCSSPSACACIAPATIKKIIMTAAAAPIYFLTVFPIQGKQ